MIQLSASTKSVDMNVCFDDSSGVLEVEEADIVVETIPLPKGVSDYSIK